MMLKSLVKRCSTLTSIASYWFLPRGLSCRFMGGEETTPPRSGSGLSNWFRAIFWLFPIDPVMTFTPLSCRLLNGLGTN